MGAKVAAVLYVLVMIALIATLDVLFLQNQLGLRLIVNIGIVAVFFLGYLALFGRRR